RIGPGHGIRRRLRGLDHDDVRTVFDFSPDGQQANRGAVRRGMRAGGRNDGCYNGTEHADSKASHSSSSSLSPAFMVLRTSRSLTSDSGSLTCCTNTTASNVISLTRPSNSRSFCRSWNVRPSGDCASATNALSLRTMPRNVSSPMVTPDSPRGRFSVDDIVVPTPRRLMNGSRRPCGSYVHVRSCAGAGSCPAVAAGAPSHAAVANAHNTI